MQVSSVRVWAIPMEQLKWPPEGNHRNVATCRGGIRASTQGPNQFCLRPIVEVDGYLTGRIAAGFAMLMMKAFCGSRFQIGDTVLCSLVRISM